MFMNKGMMKTILVTGALGFIGQAVCKKLAKNYRVVAFDRNESSCFYSNCLFVKADITDDNLITQLCDTHCFDAVIHCAGIAHQKTWEVAANSYREINSRAVEKLALAASRSNPEVYFIFLSSISVYGEENNGDVISEESSCKPTSDYAFSKLDAENHLIDLFNKGVMKKVDLLRLSPVYDRNNSFNIDKRIFAPGKLAYVLIGNGQQKMSALARGNLVGFIQYRLNSVNDQNNDSHIFCNTYNVSDKMPYTFKQIITIFYQSSYRPTRFIIRVPLFFIKVITKCAAYVMRKRKVWFTAAYKKISLNLVFDNKKMLKIGFEPEHDLSTVFLDQPDI
ncbi:Nucleoside-diphosphate-sugar epimerase [Desulfobacula phenolica]|uniref:Nucleoside-diphosphate-sugar epimerase n=2 Tax=Desulfobacula phenolica TaxID=90732 RepID=A0A1H2DP94_9BACT|nr:Nucleoside-diphosphate-sugar epimerase [Desulfobacula phenolica]